LVRTPRSGAGRWHPQDRERPRRAAGDARFASEARKTPVQTLKLRVGVVSMELQTHCSVDDEADTTLDSHFSRSGAPHHMDLKLAVGVSIDERRS
jgi:hypothetical protein